MKVFYCDDDPESRELYSAQLIALGQKHHIPLQLFQFENGQQLLFAYDDQKTPVDIIFLDINMPGPNGIEVANILREEGYRNEIVFLTVSKRHFLPAFDVRAFNYIIKNETSPDRFEAVFLKAIHSTVEKDQEYMLFTAAGEYRNVPVKAIRYFEVTKRIITVYYEDEQFEFFSSIGKLENQLTGRDFVRVHRSYLVNLAYIASISYNQLELTDGAMVPVGRTYSPELKQAMLLFTKSVK